MINDESWKGEVSEGLAWILLPLSRTLQRADQMQVLLRPPFAGLIDLFGQKKLNPTKHYRGSIHYRSGDCLGTTLA